MLELTGIADILRAVSTLYWIAGIGFLTAALYFGKRWWGKAIGTAAVLAAFSYLPVQGMIEQKKEDDFRKAADAHFQKICAEYPKETIKRKVENVEGLLLLRPREFASTNNLQDQFWMGDPYGYDHFPEGNGSDRYVFSYLKRYLYVEEKPRRSVNEVSYLRYMIDGIRGTSVILKVEQAIAPTSRYSLDWADVSTTEDRRYWIAGGKVRIVDLQTNEVIAEHIGYMRDTQFGRAGARRPWINSRINGHGHCPGDKFSGTNLSFALKVLLPASSEHESKGPGSI